MSKFTSLSLRREDKINNFFQTHKVKHWKIYDDVMFIEYEENGYE